MRPSQQNNARSLESTTLVFLFLFSAIACEAQSKCSCHELVWKDHDIQIFRLTIQPHTSSSAFWHGDDYTFVPLTAQETLESVREGETRTPFRKTKVAAKSWIARDSTIRFVHPRGTEPEDGQVIFNPDDRPYVAMEIFSNKPASLPVLETRLSMFGPAQIQQQLWALGAYAISIQSLAPAEQMKWQPSAPVLLMSASPLKMELGMKQVSLGVGDLLPLGKNPALGRNSTTLSARVLVLYKTVPAVLMASK